MSVLLDTHLWLTPFLVALTNRRSPHAPLWIVSGYHIRQDFMEAVQALHLDFLAPCQYALRHGGATHDFLPLQRSLADIKARGHWRSDASVARYAKPTHALKVLKSVHPTVLRYGKFVEESLEAVLHLQVVAPPPDLASTGLTNCLKLRAPFQGRNSPCPRKRSRIG